MKNHIEAMWKEYESMVMEEHVSAQDRAEFKHVFFTGAAAVFAVLLSTEEGDESKAALASEMHFELRKWASETAEVAHRRMM